VLFAPVVRAVACFAGVGTMGCGIVDLVAGKISVPKTVIIYNRRLGVLHRLLQVIALIWVLYNIIVTRPWNRVYTPVARGVEIWATPASDSAAAATTAGVKHCTDFSDYVYVYDSSFSYHPTKCLALPPGESFSKSGGKVFYTTYAKDVRNKRFVQGTAACTDLASSCPGNYTTETVNGLSLCKCASSEEFFVRNAEHQQLHVTHGYEVKTTLDGSSTQRGASKSKKATKVDTSGNSPTITEEDDQILSIITDTEGNECKVGGVSRWKQSMVATGVTGPLKDWLACGGMDLDAAEDSLLSFTAGESGTPRNRIAGADLSLTLTYYNPRAEGHPGDHDGVVCYIQVAAFPQFNSNTEVSYTTLPDTSDYQEGVVNYRYRYAYGVSVNFKAQGTFMQWDYQLLVTAFVTQIVILSVPATIISFIALYGAGLASKIYSRVANEPLSIVDQFHGFCARLLVSAQGFRSINEGGGKNLNRGKLLERISEAFYKPIQDGTLQAEEVARLADAVHTGLDPLREGGISVYEFIRASSSNEALRMKEIAAYFDDHRSVGCLEKIFGTTEKLSEATEGDEDHNKPPASVVKAAEAFAMPGQPSEDPEEKA